MLMRFTKNNKMQKAFLTFLLICCVNAVPILIQAQQERTTAEEVNIQKVFIEANKNKILGAYEEAERLFKEVLEKDKQNHAAAYELGRVYMAQDNYPKALEFVNLAIRIEDQNTWYHMLKADILEARQEYDDATLVYEDLIKINPKERYYYEHLTEIYQKTNQFDKALENLDRFEDLFGIIEPVIRNKFDILNELGRPQEALREVDKLIDLYPEDLDYLHLAATYAKQVDMEDRALSYYRQVLKIDPNDSRANVALASTFKNQGDDVAYLSSIRDIIRNPSIEVDAKIQELIPYVQKVMDQRDSSLEASLFDLISALEKNHPHDAKVFAINGDLFQATEQYEKARRAYERTIALDDSVFPVWDQLIAIQAKQKDWESLINTTESAMDVFPNQGVIFYYNGIAYAQKADYHEAKSSLTQALLMSGRDPGLKYNVLVQLGEVYHELANHQKSNEAFEKALEINANAFPALNQYAYFLALRKENLSEAIALIERAQTTRPNDFRGFHTKGLILLQQGDFTNAKEQLEIALTKENGSENADLWEHLGDTSIQLKDRMKAIEYWQKSLELGADEDRLTKKLNDNKVN